MNTTDIQKLAKEAGVVITAETIDDFQKMLNIVEEKHQKSINIYENILTKIAQCFYRDINKVNKHSPQTLYTKIIWGIHDLQK